MRNDFFNTINKKGKQIASARSRAISLFISIPLSFDFVLKGQVGFNLPHGI